jgi:hypothetical protein
MDRETSRLAVLDNGAEALATGVGSRWGGNSKVGDPQSTEATKGMEVASCIRQHLLKQANEPERYLEGGNVNFWVIDS